MSLINKINVVFASDDNYIQHATVAMMSILRNTTHRYDFAFYVLDDNISEANKSRTEKTFAGLNAEVYFIPVDSESFADFFVSGQLSRTSYFRLRMAELLPADLRKVIYLDCDLLVLGDIAELWEYDMQGQPLAAVPDYGIMASSKDWKRKLITLDFDKDDEYFNAGVLVVDLDLWRSNDYGNEVIERARKNAYQHHDQDALNVVFYGKWCALPLRWNVIPPIWNLFLKVLRKRKFRQASINARKDIAILHYAGGYKPWEYVEIYEFNRSYYRYFRETAFKDLPMPQFDKRRKGRSIKRQLCRLKMADFWQRLLDEKEIKC